MRRARPVPEWITDPATPAALRERLELSQRLREFAVKELALPDSASYRRFARLDRSAAVWNVVATPELSLRLQTWCMPVVGCVGYRGYFDQEAAGRLAADLRAEGLETMVYPVPAYSTLGRTDWLGGDPLLSTFIGWPAAELARLLFHEMAHTVVYVPDDTAFNESYATAVERLGLRRWLSRATQAERAEALRREQRREDFLRITGEARRRLEVIFRSDMPDVQKRRAKAQAFASMRENHRALKAGPWAGDTAYDRWFEQANNASLALQGAYLDLVPAFERLFDAQGGDFGRFHEAVRRLAQKPLSERHAVLRAQPGSP